MTTEQDKVATDDNNLEFAPPTTGHYFVTDSLGGRKMFIEAKSHEQALSLFQNKAVALAENEYFSKRPQIDCNDRHIVFRAGYAAACQQIIEELANKPEVMPKVFNFVNSITTVLGCYASEVREAIATMQAKVEQEREANERLELSLERMERDRDEWKDATISANRRFEIAERKLELAKQKIELGKKIWREDQVRIAELSAQINRFSAQEPVAQVYMNGAGEICVEFIIEETDNLPVGAKLYATMKGQQS